MCTTILLSFLQNSEDKREKIVQKVTNVEEILVDVSNKTEDIVPHKNVKGNNLDFLVSRQFCKTKK